MSGKALYPGSFDPPTRGHLDLIERGAALFGELVVAVGVNPEKTPFLAAQERVELLRAETGHLSNVSVTSFEGLVVEAATRAGCSTLLRGLRTVSDFESEFQMAMTNRRLSPGLETVFVVPNEKYAYLSSRLIKEIYGMGGDASMFLSERVAAAVTARLEQRRENP